MIDRRQLLTRGLATAGLVFLAGCDALSGNARAVRLLERAEAVSRRAQRLLSPRNAMAKEFTAADLSPVFPANGTINPADPAYQALAEQGFADWALEVGGLVERPQSFPLADLRRLPARTQITRHDCVEGWSAIGQWTGPQLSTVLDVVRPLPRARYVVFFSADPDESGAKYYESLDLEEARHPQTILAYEMNGHALPIPHGAPLRLRVERQLGYKMAKYLMRIELRDSLTPIEGGRGGYWEDQGYEWYAGI
jgi:DMSO/TMAO reductase YedYZ molybdopterin-dependent catalytic subunit